MKDRSLYRLGDMDEAITQIVSLLSGKSMEDLFKQSVMRAAFERFLEVMSEASRHVPSEWQNEYPDVEWRKIADLGNHLRHAYHKTDYELLWRVYEFELPRLQEVVKKLIASKR